MQEMSLLLKLSEAQDMQFWFVVAFALGAPVLRKSCRPTSSIWRQGEINRSMYLLFLVHRFAILLDLTEVLNIKNITLKWSLWDAEVAKKNKDILKSDDIFMKSSNVDLLAVMTVMSGHVNGSVSVSSNVGGVGF